MNIAVDVHDAIIRRLVHKNYGHEVSSHQGQSELIALLWLFAMTALMAMIMKVTIHI